MQLTTFFGLSSLFEEFSRSIFLPATKTSTFRANFRTHISSIFTPIEPVLPKKDQNNYP